MRILLAPETVNLGETSRGVEVARALLTARTHPHRPRFRPPPRATGAGVGTAHHPRTHRTVVGPPGRLSHRHARGRPRHLRMGRPRPHAHPRHPLRPRRATPLLLGRTR
ncbi:hypothetical protein QP028_02895 [Corynebacterium suedekumii]|nr:hypothetical protein QP028_02895 [Corynebacterium suedekumii]